MEPVAVPLLADALGLPVLPQPWPFAAVPQAPMEQGCPLLSKATGCKRGSCGSAKTAPPAGDGFEAVGPPPMANDPPGWVFALTAASRAGRFFSPCGAHRQLKKSEATFFCATCASADPAAGALCGHCAGAHAGHATLQVRRYVYRDVVRASDIAPFVDAAGIQTYTINSAKVVFVNPRPLAKMAPPGGDGGCGCAICGRALREGCCYCSLACRLEALSGGAAAEGGSAAGGGGGGAVATEAGSDSSDGGTGEANAAADAPRPTARRGAGGRAADQSRRRSGGGKPQGAAAAAQAAAAAAAGVDDAQAAAAAAGGAAGGRRRSESSSETHMDWQSANGHAARRWRKQPSPRRSPLT
ncbi:hypothetical protein Rsub_10514 [Raphidocelis subcapitata]|uniref:B box-type domain-containing protein n=1 Tax=Raphidocelis subcapitata TaxID=307507 RepID=A0A2V0PCR3_9CHLO|nr:hypothetical protein Rsub_10514 [Raphidocelis subcapitata]|eukprot:GBF97638.1 hypothetical protein Rsub_10514 [Raphidocelis subcapitata]